jgi:hypothetical protein
MEVVLSDSENSNMEEQMELDIANDESGSIVEEGVKLAR